MSHWANKTLAGSADECTGRHVGLEITLAGDVTICRTGRPGDGSGSGGTSPDAATGADKPRRLRSAQARVAFALLTLERQRGVTRDALAEAVWPEGLPATWESALRTVVSRVRAFVAPETSPDDAGGPLVAHGGRYLLHLPDDVVVDLEHAEACLAAAQEAVAAGDDERGRELAQTAVDRLRAPFLSDHDGDWVTGRREHLAEQLLTGLELLSHAASAQGDHATALAAANDAVGRAPLRESAHRCRMAAHAAAGNRAEALKAYQQLRSMLAEEMGVDPAQETETAYLSLLGALPPAPLRVPSAATASGAGPAVAIPSGATAPFVGREDELAELTAAWRAARAGTSRLVLVSGDAGSGKTRLATEAARLISADGALVLIGRCDPSRGTPYQPLVELLDGFLFSLPRDWTQAWRPMVRAALATVFPSVTGPDDAPPGVAHDRALLFDAVTEILVDAADDRPILVVLDNAPGADDDSLALLRHLLRHIGEAPLLVVALARTRLPPNHPFSDTVRALDHDGLVQRLPLGGLTGGDVRTLLEQLRPGDSAEARTRLARSLVADTSGNPQLVVELLRDLDDGPSRHDVPSGVQDLVERKLDELGDAAHDLLRAAAVAGQEFDLDVVEHAVGLDHLAVLDALDEALDTGLIAEVGSGYRFTQEVTRRTLYERLSEPRRRHLHQCLADAIETLRAGGLSAHAATLAQHRTAAADVGGDRRAVRWARAAALQARRDHALAEVVRLCDEALAHVPPDDAELRAEVLTDLGLALTDSGDARAERVLLDAALQALRVERRDLAAQAALGLADLARARPALRPEAAALIDDLLRSVPRDGPVDGAGAGAALDLDLPEARLLARHVELSPDPPSEPAPETRSGLGVSGAGSPRVRLAGGAMAALMARLDELAGPEDADERLMLATDLATLGSHAVDGRATALAAHHRAMAAAVTGDWKTADHTLDTAGDPAMRAERAVVVAVTQGEFATIPSVVADCHPAGATTRRQLLIARWLQGRLGTDPDDDACRDPADRALVALARGNRGQARLAMHALATGVDPLPGGDARLHSLGVLALAAVELGDAATAEAVRAQLAPYAELWCADGYRSFVGTAGFHLGRLAAVGGDLADAERYLMPALSQHAEMQARPWVALTQHALADVLDARGRSSDRDWVAALRSEVRWMAGDLGLRPL